MKSANLLNCRNAFSICSIMSARVKKIIGNKIRTDKLSALQIINIFKIFRESLGNCFHEVLSHYRKIFFFEFGVFYNGDILFHIVINGLADSFQYIGEANTSFLRQAYFRQAADAHSIRNDRTSCLWH